MLSSVQTLAHHLDAVSGFSRQTGPESTMLPTMTWQIWPFLVKPPWTENTGNVYIFKGFLDCFGRDQTEEMAEEQGFEPWVRLLPQRFSRPSHSTTLELLRMQ